LTGRGRTHGSYQAMPFTGCGKTHKCAQYRGRAALQRRVKLAKEMRASAPVVAFCAHRDFSRCLSDAVSLVFSPQKHERHAFQRARQTISFFFTLYIQYSTPQ
jgi:hypothetical protein